MPKFNQSHAPSARSKIRQSPDRAIYEQDTLYDIIDDALMATVSVSIDNEPIAVPMAIARIDDHIYLHGLKTSRLMKHLASGAPVCVVVSHLDGLVVSRSGMHCSANYRSAVIHGNGALIEDETKPEKLHQVVEAIIPNSKGDFREHLPKELKATSLIAISLEEAASKVRTGGPVDDDEDIDLPYWAGTIPITQVYGEPIDADNLPEGIETPDYARNYQRPQSRS